jgi:hypothetical protein
MKYSSLLSLHQNPITKRAIAHLNWRVELSQRWGRGMPTEAKELK